MGTPTQVPGRQYMRLRFSCVDDVDILCQVLVENPFEDPERWKSIHKRIVEISGKEFTLRAVKEHVDYLLKLFKKEDAALLRKSGTGTDEQYKEKQRLLQEVHDLQQEFPKRTTLSQKLRAMEPEEVVQPTTVVKNENSMENIYYTNENSSGQTSPASPEPEHELKKRRLLLEEQKLKLEERKIAMEERRIALEEKRVALEAMKHDEEKIERSRRVELEMKERMAYLKSMEQQQKMLSFLMKQFSGEDC